MTLSTKHLNYQQCFIKHNFFTTFAQIKKLSTIKIKNDNDKK